MKNNQDGFTLIELMIVVAVIGILSAIMVISYQGYVVKSQLNSAFIELKAGSIQYDLIMLDASNGPYNNANIGFFNSNLCDYNVYEPIAGKAEPALECKLKNVASIIQGKMIYLNKSEDGHWVCVTSTNIPNHLKPNDCI